MRILVVLAGHVLGGWIYTTMLHSFRNALNAGGRADCCLLQQLLQPTSLLHLQELQKLKSDLVSSTAESKKQAEKCAALQTQNAGLSSDIRHLEAEASTSQVGFLMLSICPS